MNAALPSSAYENLSLIISRNLAQRAQEEKKNEALERWFTQRIGTFYINIDDEYKTCPEMEKWITDPTAIK